MDTLRRKKTEAELVAEEAEREQFRKDRAELLGIVVRRMKRLFKDDPPESIGHAAEGLTEAYRALTYGRDL